MFGITFPRALEKLVHMNGAASLSGVPAGSRRIALLRSGRRHGPITRLITPWDIGELTQPFVYLCYSELAPGSRTVVGVQPGIGTLTLVLSGALVFEEALGNKGMVLAGGYKWSAPGEVLWHARGRAADEPLRTFQLWVDLSPTRATPAAESQCVAPQEVQEEGPVRVVLGQLGRARSRIVHAPPDVNYFHVHLEDGQSWHYAAPDGHNVTWLAVDRGSVRLEEDGRVSREQIALFGRSRGEIQVQAEGESSFVLGSTRRHSNVLVQDGCLPMDATLEAFMPGEVERAAVRPAVAPLEPLRTNSMNPRLGGTAVTVLDRRLARSNGDDSALRASCRSNLFERTRLRSALTMEIPADAAGQMLFGKALHPPGAPHSASRSTPYVAIEAAMNPLAPRHTHRVAHASSDALAESAQQRVVQLHGAANEPGAPEARPDPKLRVDPTEADDLRNPLWAVAIGTACLLAAMAAVITLG